MASEAGDNDNTETRTVEGGGEESVVSESTQATQTRFSFYNADDFKAKSPKRVTENNAQRLSQGNGTNGISTTSNAAESSLADSTGGAAEILESLQAHEQQRNEILQPRSSPPALTVEQTGMIESAASNDSPNPYEDAIKDALELLRRHRTGIAMNHPRPIIDTSDAGLEQQLDNKPPEISFTQEDIDALSRSLQEVSMSAEDLPAGMMIPPDNGSHMNNANSDNNNDPAALGEAYQAEIEARRKQRQERMAKYANRLAELKQEGSLPNTPAAQNATPRVDTDGQVWEENGETAPPLSANTLPERAASEVDDDVQRGVEKVLLAILERANTPDAQYMEHQSQGADAANEGKNGQTDGDLLVQAMSDLLGAPSTSSLGSSSPNRGVVQHWMEAAENEAAEKVSEEDQQQTSSPDMVAQEAPELVQDQTVPDELDEMVLNVLSKEKPATEEDAFDRRVRSILSQEKPSQNSGSEDAGEEEEDEEELITDQPNEESYEEDALSTEEEGTTRTGSYADDGSSSDGAFNEAYSHSDEDEDGDEYGAEDDGEEEDDDEAFVDNVARAQGELDGVLGPLSKKAGGTTGVVLETDSSDDEDKPKSPTILESLSAAMSIVTGRDKQETHDKYRAADHDRDEDELDEESEEDDYDDDEDEATDLMRTLCAHLLPVGVSQSKLIAMRPAWDESNPDEAGYRIIRLSVEQLSEVEDAFHSMVTGLKQNSEKQLSVAGTDEAFERDLKAAEEILDQSDLQSKRETKSQSQNAATTAVDEMEPFKFDNEVGEGESLHDFPGVKPTGRGEMGDLEYFHLPIIFKSHVTGFEPTKDMYLEQGNIVAGQYLVEGELGSAAFSTAYRCVDLNSGDDPDDQEEVCLKVIKNTKDFFDQSLDEIKILELLRQTGMCQEKCIVEMKTFFYHREHLIIVTELLRQNLFEFGKFIIDNDEEPYFTMTRLAYVTRQVLIALEFVHRLGLVHSDVKPENILLSSYSRARVKLIDFGSSCYLTDRQSSYIQSRSYRAPEVVLGLPYDGRIDIWSLGCVVAEMFTGEVTFQNDSIVSMLSRIEAICGIFPRHMIAQGRQSGRFFSKSGLLFEKVSSSDDKEDSDDHSDDSSHDDDDDDDESKEPKRQYMDVFQPKTTTLSARLGFAADLLERYDDSSVELSREESKQALFVDFVRKLLIIDPEVRPTARQALQHPWMKFAETVTEDSIRYPSEG